MMLDSELKEILKLIQKQYLYIFCSLHDVGAEKVYSFSQIVNGYALYTQWNNKLWDKQRERFIWLNTSNCYETCIQVCFCENINLML